MRVKTKRAFEEHLNQEQAPTHMLRSGGGRVPDKAKYGTWMRKNDPVQFDVHFYNWLRNPNEF